MNNCTVDPTVDQAARAFRAYQHARALLAAGLIGCAPVAGSFAAYVILARSANPHSHEIGVVVVTLLAVSLLLLSAAFYKALQGGNGRDAEAIVAAAYVQRAVDDGRVTWVSQSTKGASDSATD